MENVIICDDSIGGYQIKIEKKIKLTK